MKTLRNTVGLLIVLSLTVAAQIDWVKATDAQESAKALKCGTYGDFVEIPHSQSLNITGPLTIEVWMKSTSEDFHQTTVLEKCLTDTEWAGYSVSISEEGHVVFFSGNDRARYLKSNLALSPHQWYHIACVLRGNKKHQAEIWINGFLDTKGTLEYPSSTNEAFCVGQSTKDRRFHGEFDEVRIYSRALTEDEIESGMGQKITGSDKDIVAYYDFNELTRDGTVQDLSPFENHGTLHGDAMLVESTAPVFSSYDAWGKATEDLVVGTEIKINYLKRNNIEMPAITKHLGEARKALLNKEYGKAFKHGYGAHLRLHEIWDILESYTIIRNDVEAERKTFQEKEINISFIIRALEEAEETLKDEHYVLAHQMMTNVQLNVEKAWSTYPRIEELKTSIEMVDELGCNTGKARKKMKEATEAFTQGGYSRIEDIVQDGLTLAKQADCGMVKIMDVLGQAAKYDGKTVEIKGQIKNIETVYDRGHKIAVDDGTGLLWVEYKGSMKYLDYWQNLDYLDKVYIKGTFSEKNAMILATKVQ